MSAQRPGTGLTESSIPTAGARSYVFYPANADGEFDYLTQLPCSKNTNGELMFGRGFTTSLISEIGLADDSVYERVNGTYLSGALSMHFGMESWGEEGRDGDTAWFKGRVKSIWSGIIGMSADGLPWVGRLPCKLSGRRVPTSKTPGLASPGEWISAGYSGEGMVHAWLSGRALAYMVLGKEDDAGSESSTLSDATVVSPARYKLPKVMLPTEARWKKARAEQWLLE